jgi:hypothetical protein
MSTSMGVEEQEPFVLPVLWFQDPQRSMVSPFHPTR